MALVKVRVIFVERYAQSYFLLLYDNYPHFGEVNMNRRFIILSMLIALSGCGSMFDLFGGEDKVKNAQPVPKFTVETFKGIPQTRFLILGDWGAGGKFQRQVADAMLEKAKADKPEFIISVGDNFYPGGVNSTDDKQWKTKFEDMYTGDALAIPWYVALGNHDYLLNVDAQIEYHSINPRWNMPARYYTFEKNFSGVTVEFFVLDTDALKNGDPTEQVAWFKKALAGSKAHWKIVIGHHPIRSYGSHGEERVMVKSIKPLLDQYGVQVFLCGHEHDLQCIKNPADKFTCVVSGGGGGSRNTSYGDHTLFAATNGGFCAAIITKDKFHIQWLNRKAEVMFAHTVAHF